MANFAITIILLLKLNTLYKLRDALLPQGSPSTGQDNQVSVKGGTSSIFTRNNNNISLKKRNLVAKLRNWERKHALDFRVSKSPSVKGLRRVPFLLEITRQSY
jgi:hypothetical protein